MTTNSAFKYHREVPVSRNVEHVVLIYGDAQSEEPGEVVARVARGETDIADVEMLTDDPEILEEVRRALDTYLAPDCPFARGVEQPLYEGDRLVGHKRDWFTSMAKHSGSASNGYSWVRWSHRWGRDGDPRKKGGE